MKHERSESAPRISFWTIIVLMLLLLFVFNYLDRVNELVMVQSSASTMEREIELAQQWNLQLKNELSYYASREYVEEIARSELGYVQPGDDVFVVLGTETESNMLGVTGASGNGQNSGALVEPVLFSRAWWQLWLERLGLAR
jgi:cell division protein FtsB